MHRFINARRRILQPMLDSSCSETPKTKKKPAQNRPVQRFWPDSLASGVAQATPSELAMSEGMSLQMCKDGDKEPAQLLPAVSPCRAVYPSTGALSWHLRLKADKRTHGVKTVATKPSDLSLMPSRETNSCKFSSDPHTMPTFHYTPTHTKQQEDASTDGCSGSAVVGSAGVCIAHENGYRSRGVLSKALSCLSNFVFLSSHHCTQQRRSC